MTLGQSTTLRPDQRIEWRAQFESPLVPGMYRLRISVNAKDEAGLPIVPLASIYQFEVRPRSVDTEVEIARRDAWRQYLDREGTVLQPAEAALKRLFQLHPHSYDAFLIQGQLEEVRGDNARAIEAYARSAEILRDGQDKLLLKFKGQSEIRHILTGVERMAKPQ